MSDDYTPAQVASLLGDENVQLIDVRAPHEHEAGHIPGSRLIELGELAGMADTKLQSCRSATVAELHQ